MNKKVVAIVSVLIFLVGIFLVREGTTLVPSACWGHLGCNYYTRTFGYLAYLGIFLTAISVIGFIEGSLSKRVKIIYRVLLTVFIVFLVYVITRTFLSSLVFVF